MMTDMETDKIDKEIIIMEIMEIIEEIEEEEIEEEEISEAKIELQDIIKILKKKTKNMKKKDTLVIDNKEEEDIKMRNHNMMERDLQNKKEVEEVENKLQDIEIMAKEKDIEVEIEEDIEIIKEK